MNKLTPLKITRYFDIDFKMTGNSAQRVHTYKGMEVKGGKDFWGDMWEKNKAGYFVAKGLSMMPFSSFANIMNGGDVFTGEKAKNSSYVAWGIQVGTDAITFGIGSTMKGGLSDLGKGLMFSYATEIVVGDSKGSDQVKSILLIGYSLGNKGENTYVFISDLANSLSKGLIGVDDLLKNNNQQSLKSIDDIINSFVPNE
jgi:hypothetical protein